MKILQVAHSLVPYTFAGTEVYTYKLSRELARKNDVRVFFRVNDQRKPEYALSCDNSGGLAVYALNHTFRRCKCFAAIYSDKIIDDIFGKLLDEFKPDVVHIQHLLFLSFGIIKEVKKRGIPVIFTLNDYWLLCHKGQLLDSDLRNCQGFSGERCRKCLNPQLGIRKGAFFVYDILRRHSSRAVLQFTKNIYLKLVNELFTSPKKLAQQITARYAQARELTSQVDTFIAPSEFIKRKFLEFGVSTEKIITCNYGIDCEAFPGKKEIDPQNIKFGFIGTLLPMKGLDILISAFKEIKNNSAQLLIYGKVMPYAGYEHYHKHLIDIIKKDKRIKLMGHFDNSQISKVMQSIDALIVPSIWQENSPVVIQEAFAAKVPVIASNTGGIPELINDGINGLLFQTASSQSLRQKLEYVINNPAVIKKFRENSPPVKTITDNALEMEIIYSGLLTGAGV